MNYRESYGIHASSGILFNHELPLRGREFVTRKVTSSLAFYKRNNGDPVVLGNIDAERDWGHACDYVEGMLAMTERPQADTFVLATGQARSIRTFVTAAARCLDLDLVWEGEGVNEVAIDRATNRTVIRISPEFYRPAEVDRILGDATKAQRELGWTAKTSFETLVEEMVVADLKRIDEGEMMM